MIPNNLAINPCLVFFLLYALTTSAFSQVDEENVSLPEEKNIVEMNIQKSSMPDMDSTELADGDQENNNRDVDNSINEIETEDGDGDVVPEISDKEKEFSGYSDLLLEEQVEDAPVIYLETTTDAENQSNEITFKPLSLLGKTILPGKMESLRWVASETFYGSKLDTPVYVIRSEKPGMTLCLTAAIHGDELNGVEIVRQIINSVSPDDLSGTLIGVPIVNLLGFTRGTRYLPDRRDLNRYFPGNPKGSSASRIAYSFFEEIVRNCDRLVDFHTGSLNRTNMPQLRANLQLPDILEFTQHFGSTAVLHSRKLRGNLRTSATNAGIPAVALELGEPGTLQKKHIKEGVKIIQILLNKLNMVKRSRAHSEPQPVYYKSRWVRVNNGGLLTSSVKVGARIREGTVLGTLVNPLSNESFKVVSPYEGRLLGMALNQFMLPGYAAFNIGLVAEEPAIVDDAQSFECKGTGMDAEQVNEEFGCEANEGEEIERMNIDMEGMSGEEESELH